MFECKEIIVTKLLIFSAISGLLSIDIKAQPSYENYRLVWSDEFNDSGLVNSQNWDYEEGYIRNKELQYYTRQRLENARVENGTMIIEARRDNWNGHEYTAASLHTRGKREFQYGIFEMKAKIDVRKGSWPAFWTLGASGEWPSNGEIDIMEYYTGNLHANVAWGTNTRWQAKWDSQTKTVGSDFSNDFHIWRLLWTKDKIDLYVDDLLQNTTQLSETNNGSITTIRNPFHQKAYIMINQAIGSNGGDPSSTTFPIKYVIDYVRVYQKVPDTIPPSITNAIASVNNTISILFSEVLDKKSAETISCYSIDNNNISLTSAKLQNDGMTVLLTFSGTVKVNDKLTLTIKGVKDNADSANVFPQTAKTINTVPEPVKLTGKLIGNGEPYNGNSSFEYKAAVDGDTSTYADCIGDTVWAGYDFGAGNEMVITGIRIYPRKGYANRMNGCTIEVSNDGKIWNKVYTISQTPSEGTFSSLAIVHSEPVRFVRYNGTIGYLNVNEIEFLGYTSPSISIYHEKKEQFSRLSLVKGTIRYSLHSLTGRVVKSGIKNEIELTDVFIDNIRRSAQYSKLSKGMYVLRVESSKNHALICQKLVEINR